MIISVVTTADQQSVIGKDGKLPWRISSSRRRLAALICRHTIIVGRNTHESILKRRKGEPLKHCTTIVLSRNPDYSAEPCLTARSLEEAIEIARTRNEKELFVIGGAEIYRQALPIADRLYLTLVHGFVEGDAHFPVFQGNGWVAKKRTPVPQNNGDGYSSTSLVYEKEVPSPQPA
jgi:dihydrofolate reductase